MQSAQIVVIAVVVVIAILVLLVILSSISGGNNHNKFVQPHAHVNQCPVGGCPPTAHTHTPQCPVGGCPPSAHNHPFPCPIPPQLELDCSERPDSGNGQEYNCGLNPSDGTWHMKWFPSEDPYHPTTHYTIYGAPGINEFNTGPDNHNYTFDWPVHQGTHLQFAPGAFVGSNSVVVTQTNSCGESAPSQIFNFSPMI